MSKKSTKTVIGNIFRWIARTKDEQDEQEERPANQQTDVVATQSAIIEALTLHIHRSGQDIVQVRVPAFVLAGGKPRYRTAISDFEVVAGLDPFGNNVVTETVVNENVENVVGTDTKAVAA